MIRPGLWLRFALPLIAIIVVFSIAFRAPVRRRVTVFVVDSASSLLPAAQARLSLFRNVSHGDLVRRIVVTEAPSAQVNLVSVDGSNGQIDRGLYIGALRSILEAKMRQPARSVVINLSLGSKGRDIDEETLISRLIDAGVIVVASAGNDGRISDSYPACYPGVISVAAMDRKSIASYSSWSAKEAIAADGSYTDITVEITPDGQNRESLSVKGTSFSAPRVSGLCADMLALSRSSHFNPSAIVHDTANRVSDDATRKRGVTLLQVDGHAARAVVADGYWCTLKSYQVWIALCVALIVPIIRWFLPNRYPANEGVSDEQLRLGCCISLIAAAIAYIYMGYMFSDPGSMQQIVAILFLLGCFSTAIAGRIAVPLTFFLRGQEFTHQYHLIEQQINRVRDAQDLKPEIDQFIIEVVEVAMESELKRDSLPTKKKLHRVVSQLHTLAALDERLVDHVVHCTNERDAVDALTKGILEMYNTKRHAYEVDHCSQSALDLERSLAIQLMLAYKEDMISRSKEIPIHAYLEAARRECDTMNWEVCCGIVRTVCAMDPESEDIDHLGEPLAGDSFPYPASRKLFRR